LLLILALVGLLIILASIGWLVVRHARASKPGHAVVSMAVEPREIS
jgi:hypothetical protein